jgi:hypothetical protein
MVLLDFHFQRVAGWEREVNPQWFEEAPRLRFIAVDKGEALSLARDLVLEAWSAARLLPRCASLAFGISSEVATRIAGLSPRELEEWVVQEVDSLRLRWDSGSPFWKELFHAADCMDDESLESVHLHCLQLLGGELASLGRFAYSERRSLREGRLQNSGSTNSSLV